MPSLFKCLLFNGYLFILINYSNCRLIPFPKNERIVYKEKIRTMFYEAYGSYVENALDYDELMPISCSGMNTWGTFSLSLIDALDMLAIVDNHTEFRRVAQYILDTADFETNTNVSVFETNIRVVGGLLSAHLLSRRTGFRVEEGWPCSGPLLRLAHKVATKLLPAFDTPTGMPYGTVNFLDGVPENETPVTCTAGVGTFIVEFGTLSRLTGDPIFEEKALNALKALQKFRSKIGLLGNHINILDGKWTATDAGIGAGVDSYFEYLVKGSMLLQMPSLIEIFHYDYDLIKNYFKKNDWFIWVSMITGSATMPIFQSLEAFFPGLLTLIGDIDQAKKSLYNYHQVWKQYGFVPEFYDIVHGRHHKREGYPLRPEFIESVFYLYQATKDDHLLSIGADVVDSIYYSARTDCGYATIKTVSDHTIEDRMESFFLAETLKYLFLLFDEQNFINENGSFGTVIELNNNKQKCVIESGGYVFNTEAHPIDIAAISCCKRLKDNENELDDNINLYDLFIESNKQLDKKLFYYLESNNVNENINDTEIVSENFYSTIFDSKSELDHQSIVDKTKNFEEAQINFSEKNEEESSTIKRMPTFLHRTENETHCTSQISLPTFSSSSILVNKQMNIGQFFQNRSLSTTIIEVKNSNSNKNDKIERETILNENKFFLSNDNNHELLACPSQTFFIRLSLYGQMFT